MGDVRLDARGRLLFESIVSKNSLVLRTIGGGRKGEVAASRFLDNDSVDPAMILAEYVERTRAAAAGLRVVVAQDTTEISFSGRAGRRKGLGPAGDGRSPGFFMHPQVAIDAATGAMLGPVGAEIWTREDGRAASRRSRALGEKESLRWLTGMRTASEVLSSVAASLVVVGDRESDIYSVLAMKPAGIDIIVRAAQNRALDDGGLLKSAGEHWRVLARETIELAGRRAGDAGGPMPARTATVAISAGTVRVLRPERPNPEPGEPASLTLGLVIVTESDPPAGAEPVCWRLLTSLPVADARDAREVIRLYRLRWRIEEVFRALKTDGLDLEASQVTNARRLFNLAALGLAASVRIIQLVDARDGSERPASDVIEPAQYDAVAAISKSLEGSTERQRNPHAKGSLAWLAWVCGRLGGWNCYYKPPGTKTMAQGWTRLTERLEGYDIARTATHD